MPRRSEEQLRQLLAASQNDKAERKRLLGLLAQRRYRYRRKTELKSSPISGEDPGDTLNHTEDTFAEPGSILDGSEDWLNFNTILDSPASCYESSVIQGEGQASLSYLPQDELSLAITKPNQCLQAQDFNDESYISTPALDVVKAHITILTTLLKSVNRNPVVESIWNPFARSPFEGGRRKILGIPEHYCPTEAQITKPHHPVFDLLPWPKVRNKVLLISTLPLETRPEVLQDSPENVVMRFKFDMLDAAEGVRIHGLDAFNAQNWEIGQKLFDGWWWAFDMEIIHNSNMHRARRGAEKLKLKKPSRQDTSVT